jgi:hypothetical protein
MKVQNALQMPRATKTPKQWHQHKAEKLLWHFVKNLQKYFNNLLFIF